jgi:hypothetical protein
MNSTPESTKAGIVWMKTQWRLRTNPFPSTGIARLGGTDNRENGLLFRPEVQQEKVTEAIEKYVLGAAYSGLKFGYLWSLGASLSGDQRGFGKSSMLQYLVEQINQDFGRSFFLQSGLEETDADEHPLCAMLASFDMANARSLAAVFFEATRYACRFSVGDEPTLASRLRTRLISRLGTDDQGVLENAILKVWNEMRGRNLGPPVNELVELLCVGDPARLGHFIDSVKPGSRSRVSAANYLATFLLFSKAAGVPHILLGCDQLEDFAATSTTRQKRTIEVERFRDYVLEIQPMADMLTIVVTLHPRAQQAIQDMWRLADLPDLSPDRIENQSRVVVLNEIDEVERVKALLRPYMEEARIVPPPPDQEFMPFASDAIEVLFTLSDGKPRDLLRKAHALIERGSAKNWAYIDRRRAKEILESLPASEGNVAPVTTSSSAPLEELWIESST